MKAAAKIEHEDTESLQAIAMSNDELKYVQLFGGMWRRSNYVIFMLLNVEIPGMFSSECGLVTLLTHVADDEHRVDMLGYSALHILIVN